MAVVRMKYGFPALLVACDCSKVVVFNLGDQTIYLEHHTYLAATCACRTAERCHGGLTQCLL
jgi:hypothetical protein